MNNRSRSKSRGPANRRQQAPRLPDQVQPAIAFLTSQITDPYIRFQIECAFANLHQQLLMTIENKNKSDIECSKLNQELAENRKKSNKIIETKNNEISKLKNDQKRVKEENEYLRQTLRDDEAQYDMEMSDKREEMEKLKRILKTKDEQLSKLENKTIPCLRATLDKLLNERARNNSKSEEILIELEKQKEDNKKVLEELKKELADKREKLEQANTKITDLLIKLERQRNGNRSPSGGQWKEEMEEKDRIIKLNENRIEDLKKELDSQSMKYNRMIHEAITKRAAEENEEVECVVCLLEVDGHAEPRPQCKGCKKKCHVECLEIWHNINPKCPNCQRSTTQFINFYP